MLLTSIGFRMSHVFIPIPVTLLIITTRFKGPSWTREVWHKIISSNVLRDNTAAS